MSDKQSTDNLAFYGFWLLIGIFTVQIYIFAHPLIEFLKINNLYLDKAALKLREIFLFFRNIWVAKLMLIAIDVFVVLLGSTPKKKIEIDMQKNLIWLIFGLSLFFLVNLFIITAKEKQLIYYFLFVVGTFVGLLIFHGKVLQIKRLISFNLGKDRFNREAVQFMQTLEKIETPSSVNIPYEFLYQNKIYKGYINFINLFRALAVLGVPGSGKSYAIIEEVIKQFIQKGFSMYVYDYKYPTLSQITYNYLLTYHDGYKKEPSFYVINFDNLAQSSRCNPLSVRYITDITDAVESSKTFMYALNKSWAKKDGDFFPDSAVNFVAACIWVLRTIEISHPEYTDPAISNGKECSTIPHLIQLVSLEYDKLFPLLDAYADEGVKNIIAPYLSAYQKGATDQLEGQLGTVRIALARLTSPILYWIMSKDEVPFQINDPENPVLLCVGNNPQRKQIYGAAISLINFRVMQLVNQQGMNPCGLIIDELPTIYPGKGTIDDLIGTGRSNKIATVLGFQDTTQMVRDLGKESAEAIIGTIGNVASGTVLGQTADSLSKRMGKIKIRKESISISKQDTSTSLSEEMVDVLPPSEISNLAQGTLFGIVADEFGREIEEKRWVGRITLDKSDQTKHPIPEMTSFYDDTEDKIAYENCDTEDEAEAYKKDWNKRKQKYIAEAVNENFRQIAKDVVALAQEIEIKNAEAQAKLETTTIMDDEIEDDKD